ncbi:MAG: hypothetical protein ABIG52_00960 [Nanoarchaeota archaeon]
MIGLVVIVILITLGMLFMAIFAFKSESKKKIFTRKGLTYSAMSAIMKTTVSSDANCAVEYFGKATPQIGAKIVDDCANYPDVEGYSLYRCKGPISGEQLHSCEFLREMTVYLLNETLGSWNKNYEFQSKLITFQGSEAKDLIEPIRVNGGCPKWKERDSSGAFPINTEAGLVENVLFLCD